MSLLGGPPGRGATLPGMGIQPQELIPFIDRAFDGMVECIRQLGDERVNLRPELPGANTPYAIVSHCIGVSHWWVGMMGAGRAVERDRDAEFVASGTVAELEGAVAAIKKQLRSDVGMIDPQAPIRRPDLLPAQSSARLWNQGEALVHAYEELAQHHGQLELTRDLLLDT